MNIPKTAAVVGILVGLVAVSCSKKSNPAGPEEKQNLPTVTIQQIAVPEHMAQSSNPNAQMAANYIGMANGFASFAYAFTPPNGLAKPASVLDDPTWRRTWTHNGLTVTLSVFETVKQYIWETRLDGKDENFTYANWLFMKIEEAKNGKSGTMTLYKPVTSNVQAEWTWETDTQDAYTLIYLLSDGESGSKLTVTQNADHSGSLQLEEISGGSFVPSYQCQWDSKGTGSWKQYSNGEVVSSGSWG